MSNNSKIRRSRLIPQLRSSPKLTFGTQNASVRSTPEKGDEEAQKYISLTTQFCQEKYCAGQLDALLFL
jgi:hypothetical protein